jgi:hypothetical protein
MKLKMDKILYKSTIYHQFHYLRLLIYTRKYGKRPALRSMTTHRKRSGLGAPVTAFFASRQCPGTAIRTVRNQKGERRRLFMHQISLCRRDTCARSY